MGERKQGVAHAKTPFDKLRTGERREEVATENGLSSPLNDGSEPPSSGWPTVLIADALEKVGLGKQNQIQSSEMLPHGRFPVIDQGQTYIAGYCDDDRRAIRSQLPLVVFGDHTRCVKYVDFPFVLGADGTKILKPKTDLLDAKFFYYALRSVDIPNRGYNRHFTVLKERRIPVPPLAAQREIAAILGQVQKAIEEQERLLALTEELKRTLLHRLFTLGFRNEPQKQTEIGPVPEGWKVCTVGDVAKVKSGGTPDRATHDYWYDGSIPWVKTGEIDYCVICDTEEKITPIGLADSATKLFPAGTLLMAMYGQGITRGRVALLGIDAATNQACAAILPHDEARVSSRFLYYFFEYHYENLRKLGHGANQRNMNAALIRGFHLAIPDPEEQAEIVEILSVLDAKRETHKRKRATLYNLFNTLLNQLMTGQSTCENTSQRLGVSI